MKKAIAGTFIAATFAVGLSAQQPPQSPTPQSPTPQSPTSQAPMQESKDAAKTVTVTGCLKAGDSADSFTLSDLKWGYGQGGRDRRLASTPASAADLRLSSLKLVPARRAPSSNDHVGHTVEVSGTIGDKAPGAASRRTRRLGSSRGRADSR